MDTEIKNINIEVLDFVIECLLKFPCLNIELKRDIELSIYKESSDGFDILLVADKREITLYFGMFHWHYNYTETEINEMIDRRFFALTGVARIKEFSKDNEAYKWILEIVIR